MGEGFKGQYAPDLYNEQKRYYLLQAQEQTCLTDAELRDMHLMSNTNVRRFIQDELGDSAIRDGFKIAEHPTDTVNNFLITGGLGTVDDPGVMFLKGYRLALRNDIGYKDQTSVLAITADAYTQTVLPTLNTPTGSVFDYNGLAFNAGNIVIVGSSSTNTLKSSDSGRNYADRNYSSLLNLYTTAFSDSSTVYAVGCDVGSSVPAIMKSTSTGNSWINLYTFSSFSSKVPDGTFYGVDFINSSAGYIVGTTGQIYHTANGGSSWTLQNPQNPIQVGDYTSTLKSVSAYNVSNVWAVGDSGTILYSSDAATWSAQTSPVSTNLNSVFNITGSIVIACGNSGVIIRTLNSGSTWLTKVSDTTVNLNSIFFVDSNVGWAVGNGGIITKSLDGGSTWDSTVLNSSFDLKSIYFTDTTGFIAGSSGALYRTLDGINWYPYRTDYVYVDFHLAEVSGDTTSGSEYTDSTLVDSLIGLPSANRLRIVQDIKVSEGWPTPTDYTTSDGTTIVQHYTTTLATLHRIPGQSDIYTSDITDSRSVVRTVAELDYALKNGGIDGSSIAAGSISPSKLDSNADYTFGSVHVLRDTTVYGNLKVDGIFYVDSSKESIITDSLTVNGSTRLGDATSPFEDSVTIYGSIIQNNDTSVSAYNLHAYSGASNAPLINVQQDSSGSIMRIKSTVASNCHLFDMTSVGKGYDFNVSHAGIAGGIIKSWDDSTNTSYLIQKDATGSTASVIDITTNSYGPAINIHNTALCDSYSVKIDQSSGNALVINALSDASSIVINSSSSGTDLKIRHQGSSGYVMDVTSAGTGLLKALNTNGVVATITQQANKDVFNLTKTGTGDGRVIEINHYGVQPAVQINTLGDGIGLHVSHTGDSSAPGVDIFIAGNETGPGLRVTKANNDSTADVGQAIYVVNQGFSSAVEILHDNTDSTSSLLVLTNYTTGYDASALGWHIDRSGNFVTEGDVTSSKYAFDSTYYLTSERFFLDSSNFDSSNPGIAGRVFQDSGFLRISDGTVVLPPPGGFGMTGLQGMTGITGETGIQGYGDTGIQGETGILGNIGATGIRGLTGIALGETGIQGVTGILGNDGATGIQGVTGILGIDGVTGIMGLGTTGIQGVTGIIGVTGLEGEEGLPGDPGVTGVMGIGQTGIQGVTGILGIGETGIKGVTGLQAPIAISSSLFDAGDSVVISTGTKGLPVGIKLNGKKLTDVLAIVATSGISSTTDVTVRRRRAGSEVFMLTTATKVPGGSYYANDGVVNPSNETVQTGDLLYIDVTNVNTTAPLGLSVVLTFDV